MFLIGFDIRIFFIFAFFYDKYYDFRYKHDKKFREKHKWDSLNATKDLFWFLR